MKLNNTNTNKPANTNHYIHIRMKASIVINTNANIYTDINIHISIHTPTNMNTHTLMNGKNNISKNTDTKHLYIG